jgi:hypothetical protein
MKTADPSDQHKVAVVRVQDSVKLIDSVEETGATADVNIPANGLRQSRVLDRFGR